MTAIITLVAVALLLFFFEIFVPGGILGVFGLIATIAACTLAYQEYQLFGALLTFLIIIVGAVVIFLIMMKVLPKARLTRGLFLSARHTATSNVPLADDRIVGQRGEAHHGNGAHRDGSGQWVGKWKPLHKADCWRRVRRLKSSLRTASGFWCGKSETGATLIHCA